jgi:undecaprenyl-diphosphatase
VTLRASAVALDRALFAAVNQRWTCAALDRFLPWLTDLNRSRAAVWLVLPAVVAVWLWRDRRTGPAAAAALLAAVAASDALCHLVLKPWFGRLRPEYAVAGVVLRAGHHSPLGFPSNHAANCFAAAVVLGCAYPRLRAAALAVAALVAYSRVYVGAHFPADVLGGALVGAALGAAAAVLRRKASRAG